MSTFQITKENTAATLTKRAVLTAGISATGVRVIHVSADSLLDGNGREYHIVNLAACTKRQAAFAIAAFKAGNYAEALNGNSEFGRTSLSARVYPDAAQLPVVGDVCNVRTEMRFSEKVGTDIEVIAAISVAKPVVPPMMKLQMEEEPVEKDIEN
jgi:hypothetical protein